MSKKNILKDYLSKIMKDKSQADLTNALGMTDEAMVELLSGSTTITTQQAITIAKFTNTDPSDLLHKQTERDLTALGVQAKAKPETVAPSTTTTSSSRSPAFREEPRRTPAESTIR